MRIHKFIGLIFKIILFTTIFVDGQSFDIKTQCMDADDRTIHAIDPKQSWSLEGACKLKYCKEVRDKNNYNTKFAIVVESSCQPIPSPPYKPPYDIKNCKEYEKICEVAPKSSKKEFPACCPRQICICGSKIWQWTTNDKGKLSIKKLQSNTTLIKTGTGLGGTPENSSSGGTTSNVTSGEIPGSSSTTNNTSGEIPGNSSPGVAVRNNTSDATPGSSSTTNNTSGEIPGNSSPGVTVRNNTSDAIPGSSSSDSVASNDTTGATSGNSSPGVAARNDTSNASPGSESESVPKYRYL